MAAPMLALAAVGGGPLLTPTSVAVSALVAVLAFVLAGMAMTAARRRGNRNLRVVAIAFIVFGVKNIFSAYNVLAHIEPGWPAVAHDALELVLSLFDLALILLLFAPLVLRRKS